MNVYSYPDESGNVCYRTVRTPEKDFRVERPDGQGGWSNGLDGLEPIPYRLPEVLQAIADGLPIYVVEGEKDVDRMFAEGLVATTNPFGAGKWKGHYADKLKGAGLKKGVWIAYPWEARNIRLRNSLLPSLMYTNVHRAYVRRHERTRRACLKRAS